jgi:hypothetical protein
VTIPNPVSNQTVHQTSALSLPNWNVIIAV